VIALRLSLLAAAGLLVALPPVQETPTPFSDIIGR
jgi:hypothetical protein